MGNSLDSLIFRPPPPSYSINDPHLHLIPTPDGKTIAAYFIKHRTARFTIIFSHGNAEDIGNVFNGLINRMSKWNCNVFMYDYPGYGLSNGVASENSLYYYTDIAYKYLINTLQVDKSTVIAYGRSLGCSCAMYLGVRYKLFGLILQSPFLSIYRIKCGFSLPFDRFNNLEKARYLRCPTLVLHGEADEVISVRHSAELIRSIPDVYYHFVKRGRHNDLDYYFVSVMDRCLIEFFNFLMMKHISSNSQDYYDEDMLWRAEANNPAKLLGRATNKGSAHTYYKKFDLEDTPTEAGASLEVESAGAAPKSEGLKRCFPCGL